MRRRHPTDESGGNLEIVLPTDFAFGTSSSDKGKEIKKTFSNGKEISSSDTSFVTYVFEMKSMERAKDPWALTGEEKVELSGRN